MKNILCIALALLLYGCTTKVKCSIPAEIMDYCIERCTMVFGQGHYVAACVNGCVEGFCEKQENE